MAKVGHKSTHRHVTLLILVPLTAPLISLLPVPVIQVFDLHVHTGRDKMFPFFFFPFFAYFVRKKEKEEEDRRPTCKLQSSWEDTPGENLISLSTKQANGAPHGSPASPFHNYPPS